MKTLVPAMLFILLLLCSSKGLTLPSGAGAGKSAGTAEMQPDESAGTESAAMALRKNQLKRLPLFQRFARKVGFGKLKYCFVAQNAASCDLFYGLVEDNPLIGYATVDFTFPSGCECHGHALVTHYPLFGGVVGQKGHIKAKCSDGRTLKGNFITTSLTTGSGTMSDSSGNDYQFTFGHTAEEAIKLVNELRRQLHCPECDARDIELKVQGQVLQHAR